MSTSTHYMLPSESRVYCRKGFDTCVVQDQVERAHRPQLNKLASCLVHGLFARLSKNSLITSGALYVLVALARTVV